ncbi:Na/Pi cotransporter family protein [Corallincola luteus]|uniref:Na/Pi cotransporter family protein n=1 Tax=Corallincola luteus TaxID=1775177 RepID=UPI00196BA814|nr:Na/Pi symporter [Corallincola luteus]
MIKKLILPLILVLLSYGFWAMPQLKEILAGVAIFLFGMLALEDGFKSFTGGVLERLLKRTTNKLWKSLSFGVLTTTLMQSSSLVTIITISFLSAGLLPLMQGVGIIFGANLGTTTGAWLVAAFGLKVKISAYAMPLLVFGVILVFQKLKTLKGVGYLLAGIGFLFLGIHYMKEGFETFQSSIVLSDYMADGIAGLLIFTLLGMAATVVMQSSHATLVLIITALAAGQITYYNALALAIGANVGTTITAIIGALGANIEGKRLAAAHLVFNLVTGITALVLIVPLANLVDGIAETVGIGEQNYTLKLALFHTLFNALGIALMLPFIKALCRGLEHYLRTDERRESVSLPLSRPDRRREQVKPLYLKKAVLNNPDTALKSMIMETHHLFDNVYGVIARGLMLDRSVVESDKDLNSQLESPVSKDAFCDIDELYQRYIQPVYSELFTFAATAQPEMNSAQSKELFAIKATARDLVNAVKDIKHLQKNLRQYLVSDNVHICQQYGEIRSQIAFLLRRLYFIRHDSLAQEDNDAELVISQLRMTLEKNDVISNDALDELIRHRELTPRMTSSLMNDSHYCRSISKNLIDTVEVLMTAGSGGEGVLSRELALAPEEVEALLASEQSETEAGDNG